jgi:hypothetical protein
MKIDLKYKRLFLYAILNIDDSFYFKISRP